MGKKEAGLQPAGVQEYKRINKRIKGYKRIAGSGHGDLMTEKQET